MQRSSRPRSAAELSDSLHRQLSMYALAASAAGVGMLALAQPAEAKIVYTPADENIGPITYLDLNHDGINDFKFTTHHTAHSTHCLSGSAALAVYGSRLANKISGESVFASALATGAYIGPAGKFRGEKMALVAGGCSTGNGGASWYGRSGFWAGPAGGGIEDRYLGLKFSVKGKIHFGWARLNVVTSNLTIQATLTGYAYETIPNKAIIAGKEHGADDSTAQPASLGHLAAGASAIPAWRSGR
jgi:hypothetical protein